MEKKYKERIGKKMKVMLVCNAGMSTGILAKKIEEASDGKLECKAYGEAEYLDHIKEGYELLLIGPQIRHLKKQIEESVSIPVDTIAPQYYGMMNGKGVFKEIEKKYNLGNFTTFLEEKLMPIATKFSTQRHLKAIRDAFICIMPITLAGGIVSVISAAPAPEGTTNGFLLAWAGFVSNNNMILSWINAITMGAMSLYVTIALTSFLAKSYKLDNLLPILLSLCGFVLTCVAPIKLAFDGKTTEISYLDGKGILAAIFISILTVELYRIMREKNFGRIKLPDSVPDSLSETFASLCPGIVLIALYSVLFIIFFNMKTTLPGWVYTKLAPAFTVADSMPFVVIMTAIVQLFWFFGVHDAAFSGILAPIRESGLSVNAAAKLAGHAMPRTFTTPFWVYFCIIGGCGSVLALAILLCKSKSKQLKTVGRVGLIPAFFNISEPIIFGVPLMLNPIFFIPFILTSTLNCFIAYLCTSLGIIGKSFAMLSWNMPSVFGAFLSTMDIKALILVVALIVLDGVIYYPFLKVQEKELLEVEEEE